MYSHTHGWLVLVFVGIITATARHYFNQKHLGHKKPQYLWVPALATIMLIIFMRPAPIEPLPVPPVAAAQPVADPAAAGAPIADTAPIASPGAATDATVAQAASTNTDTAEAVPVAASADDAVIGIVQAKCSVCHMAQPTQAGFNAPPAGIIIQTPEDIKTYQAKIVTAVQSKYMPLGNITNLSDEERAQIVAYASGL